LKQKRKMQHSGENLTETSGWKFIRTESLKIERLERKGQMVVKQIEMKFDNLKETEQYRRIQGWQFKRKERLKF